MQSVTFITGNQRKVDYLKQWLGLPVRHHKLDLDELQSLDTRVVAEHKARQAYKMLQEPVLIEDTALTFVAMGRLPGTYIKWFLEEIGAAGLCKIAGTLPSRQAYATVTYAFCDGKDVHFFTGRVDGVVAPEPRGGGGMGWDPAFIPDGSTKTFAEMTPDEVTQFSPRVRAIKPLKAFLLAQHKGASHGN
ncbi:MAG TPA: non-canonical purine NTP pyrophosphatase [Candidatus Saccharimonadales bacterium]|nr:non-canonical purine NTP pyrophosphatase [Candidatus Saccharimonadales bacterium]